MIEMDKALRRETIVKRIAKEFEDGYYVNLGVGMPSLVANYLPEGVHILLHGENGMLGMGEHVPVEEGEQFNCVDAGGAPVKVIPGGAFFDSCTAFAMARGGHLDCTVLGALEVDQEGNLANWWIPGVRMPGMGGAMDLVVGAKRVIVAMEHTAKGGAAKILKKCRLPLTAVGCVDTIVTELGFFRVTPEGLVVEEINPNATLEEVRAVTEAELIVPAGGPKPMF